MIHPVLIEANRKLQEWEQQREQCRRCAYHVGHRDGVRDHSGERCAKSPYRAGNGAAGGRMLFAYCIDARERDGVCGPQARLFKERS
jgi:hypothetical protein